MMGSLNMEFLKHQLEGYLFETKEYYIKRVYKTPKYSNFGYWDDEIRVRDDEAEIINSITFLFADLGAAGFYW